MIHLGAEDKFMPKRSRDESEHPRFDNIAFQVVYDPVRDRDTAAVQVLSRQGQEVLDVLTAAVVKKQNKTIGGRRLREVLEAAREKHFGGTRQKEIFRIFQDYRARFVRAGFVKIVDDDGATV